MNGPGGIVGILEEKRHPIEQVCDHSKRQLIFLIKRVVYF
jgi:hypothetical protein